MLQQTQVERVARKYPEFVERFPNVRALAAAALPEVLSLWQGLGYNRRGLALHKAANTVVESYGARIPSSPAVLRTLPGIGPYTAGAIAAFAFNVPAVFVDTNIRSVYLEHFFASMDGVKDQDILPLVEQTLDRSDPRVWYYALMDYGVWLKQDVNPGRRSAHHRRQAPFEGSNRQARSTILRTVLGSPGIVLGQLPRLVNLSAERVQSNVAALQREGFLRIDQDGRLFVD
jgi:A/G-specific adenine glycosylase